MSGVITTAVTFDRERQREFTLSVTATDQAEEPLIGICQITVLITDRNDNDPKFENSRYQCECSPVVPPCTAGWSTRGTTGIRKKSTSTAVTTASAEITLTITALFIAGCTRFILVLQRLLLPLPSLVMLLVTLL